ncbi:RHS repeat domain-containing protein [Aquimarina algiphila]|uniref:RHS repeat protein n=1 Tax=Aquimarina algiphila TaxID=2047982 RepID=A0A554VNB9_9FLAO|nr:RHS repeat domain-containing protein [Aquimarina algiphila]TSE09848.1 RHS repeat protein [Aquimarina algiphila]
MIRKHLLCVIGMFYAFTFGQELPQLSPPTPEVAAIGKYTDIPVGLNTGTPNISIPLMSLSEFGIEVPVSVNYHASGIKVNEIASRIGIGWSLAAGGMITRQVRGIPDDEKEGFLNTTNTVDAFFNLTPQQQALAFDDAVRSKTQDYESDLYYFNFPGGSGKFFFDQQGAIYSHPKNDHQIRKITGQVNNITTILGWEVITPQGMTYTFGIIPGSSELVTEVKRNLIYGENSQLPSGFTFHTSGWYLTQIRDYKGNSVRFNYSKGTTDVVYYSLLDQKKYLPSIVPGANGNCNVPDVSTSLSEDRYLPTYLTTIEGTQGSIQFNYDTSRNDLKNDKALTAVTLKDANDNVIDSYRFEHGYFTTAPWERLGTYGDLDQRTKKLYLKKIKQQKGSVINKEHSFSYYEDHAFPERLSFNKDFWDYSNGADNDVLYPGAVYTNGYGNPVDVNGADRAVNSDFAQTLLLKEIVYPTKGSTEFIYESNTVTGGKAFFAGNTLKSVIITGSQITTSPDSSEVLSSSFTLPEKTLIYYRSTAVAACDNNLGSNDCPTLWLADANGNTLRTFRGNSSDAQPFELEAGTYTVNAQNGLIPTSLENGIPRYDNTASLYFYKKEVVDNNGSSTSIAFTGGLRIKEMRFKDTNGSLINTKKYEYRQFAHPELSSGFASNPPSFIYLRAPFFDGSLNCTFNIIQSNSLFPQNGLSSYHVGYTNVTEFNTDNSQGKTEYTYRFIPDDHRYSENNQFLPGEGYPFAPAKDYSHQRGLLLGTKVYKFNPSSQNFSIVEELSNIYTRKGEFLSGNIAMGYIGSASPEYTMYNNFSDRYLMTGTEKTSYYPSGNVKITTQYTFDEGYQGRTFPTTITTTDSNGDSVETKTYYPDDVSSADALGSPLTATEYSAISNLKKSVYYRITEPIQQETRINNVLATKQLTKYQIFGSITLPKSVQVAKGSRDLENRIEYLNYDSQGNPLEVTQTDGSHTIYIWGYNDRYPIAKIDHASYIDMPAAVHTLITQLKTNTNQETNPAQEATIRGLIDDLRSHTYFANAQITSFTYDPLIGVTSVTDPRGYTMTYHYDIFNRLEHVKDAAGKLISENKYGYKN